MLAQATTLPRMAVSKKLKIAGWVATSILLIGIGVGVWLPKLAVFRFPDGEVRVLKTSAIVQKIQGLSQLSRFWLTAVEYSLKIGRQLLL